MRVLQSCLAAASVTLVLVTAGCTLAPPKSAHEVDWSARQEKLLALDAWQARGRIAVKYEGGGGQGDLQWQQRGQEARLRLSGPFGAGAYEIRWDADELTISSRDGEFSRAYAGADSAQQFLQEHLGWSFPAASIRYWLLGLPDPAFAAEQVFSEAGQLISLVQNGWTVTYERFRDDAALIMPAKLSLQSTDARVRVLIDRWCLAPDCEAR